jgi:hypothetical protein
MSDLTKLCRKFLAGSNIEDCVREFTSDCKYVDEDKFRQLLTYLSKDTNKGEITNIKIYPVLDGRYGYNPPNDKLLIVELPKRPQNGIRSDGSVRWWVEPECYSPSGGNYVCTRADIRR